LYKEQSHEFLRGRVTLETKPRLHSRRVHFRFRNFSLSHRLRIRPSSLKILQSSFRRPLAAFHLFCPFCLRRKLRSFILFFSSCSFLIPKHPSVTNFDVRRSKKSSGYHGDRPAQGSSLSSDSDLRQLEYDRSVTLFVSLEPSFHRPFHLQILLKHPRLAILSTILVQIY